MSKSTVQEIFIDPQAMLECLSFQLKNTQTRECMNFTDNIICTKTKMLDFYADFVFDMIDIFFNSHHVDIPRLPVSK